MDYKFKIVLSLRGYNKVSVSLLDCKVCKSFTLVNNTYRHTFTNFMGSSAPYSL